MGMLALPNSMEWEATLITSLNNHSYRYAFVRINLRLPKAGDKIIVPKGQSNEGMCFETGDWAVRLHSWDKGGLLAPEQLAALACIPMWPKRMAATAKPPQAKAAIPAPPRGVHVQASAPLFPDEAPPPYSAALATETTPLVGQPKHKPLKSAAGPKKAANQARRVKAAEVSANDQKSTPTKAKTAPNLPIFPPRSTAGLFDSSSSSEDDLFAPS